jgi:hypothetical protein
MESILDFVSTSSNVIIAVGTVIILFLIFSQLREMSRQTQELKKSLNSATCQTIVNHEAELWQFLSEDLDFMTKFVAGMKLEVPPGLTSKDIIYLAQMAGHGENLYYQFRHGALPEQLWAGWAQYLKRLMNEPMFRSVWIQIREWYWAEFRSFLEENTGGQLTSEDAR